MIWKKLNRISLLLLLPLQGCGIYSFSSGAPLPPELKTFSLQFHANVALGPSDLAEKFQQRLSDTLLQRTALQEVHTEGDVQIKGVIKQFKYVAMAPTKGDQEEQGSKADIERLTIEVALDYSNPHQEGTSFSEKKFTQHADMIANADRNSEEPRLIEEVLTKLVEDILSETVENW